MSHKFVSPGCCPASYGTIVWRLANTRAVFGEGSHDEHRNSGPRGPERTGWAVYTTVWRTIDGRGIYQMRGIDRCPECGAGLTGISKCNGVVFPGDGDGV